MTPTNIAPSDPSVKNYARDLSKVKIVNREEELKLFYKYRDHKDLDARNKLIESGLRFVVKVAQKFSKDLEHQKTLISAGNEGLLVAVDRYDPTRGTRYLSYATWWVMLYIREEIHRSSVVSVPIWRKKSQRKVQTVQEKLREKLGRDASFEEIQEETGFSVNQIKDVLHDKHQMVPLEYESDIEAESHLERDAINKTADRLVFQIMMHLPIRERFIVQAYYGFITDPPMSLKQIATILNISSERVRQIKIEALSVLRRSLADFAVNNVADIYQG